METQPEIPRGFVLIPKGGRPKKVARDVAVHLACLMKTEELGKVYLAVDFVITEFGLNDAAHVRKCRKNARKSLSDQAMVICYDKTILFLDATRTPQGIEVSKEAKGWAWGGGLKEAHEIKALDSLTVRTSNLPTTEK